MWVGIFIALLLTSWLFGLIAWSTWDSKIPYEPTEKDFL